MKTKIIVCIIVTLLCTTVIPILGIANESKNKTIDIVRNGEKNNIITAKNNDGDFLDQYQNSTDTYWPHPGQAYYIHGSQWVAQGFTPRLNILTRVELFMFKTFNPPKDFEIVFSIRESLTGVDLTSMTLKSDEFPPNNQGIWIEFNFEDITVIPNSLYYMICRVTNSSDGGPSWLIGYPDPYKNGENWASHDYGKTWDEMSIYDCCFRTYGFQDNPPNTPTITGQTNGTIRNSYNYTITTTDPDQDEVKYFVDWGDNNSSGWIGPYNSGDTAGASHSWDSEGTYNIRVKARDEHSIESDWAILTVTMPYSYNKPIPQFLDWLFQRFPNAFPLLRQFIEY